MYKTPTGIYQSEMFDGFNFIHGFSTKIFGDMQNKNDRKKFLTALGIDESSLVQEEQVHGDSIHSVQLEDQGKMIQGVDGLVYCHSGQVYPVVKREAGIQGIKIDSRFCGNDSQASIVLSVHTADCTPLLFFDPMIRIIGSAHAGWKGTILHIGKKMVSEIEKLGGHAKDIRVVIGPRICGLCYDVTKARADMFKKEFPDEGVVAEHHGKLYVDIGKANYLDLLVFGVKPEHIDYDPALCTFCKNDEFHSFRKNGKKLEGEIMGVIGVRN